MTEQGRPSEPFRITVAKYGGLGSVIMLCGMSGAIFGLGALLLSIMLALATLVCCVGITADLYGDAIKRDRGST